MRFLVLAFALTSSFLAHADGCKKGRISGFTDATQFIAQAPRVNDKTYTYSKDYHFIKGIRKTQIEATFQNSLYESFHMADEAMIHKFEIPGTPHTSYDSLTVIYANSGDILLGAVFANDSSVVWARLEEDEIQLCAGWDGI
jgi:hypothetical protein